jgi:hypothetical protein
MDRTTLSQRVDVTAVRVRDALDDGIAISDANQPVAAPHLAGRQIHHLAASHLALLILAALRLNILRVSARLVSRVSFRFPAVRVSRADREHMVGREGDGTCK